MPNPEGGNPERRTAGLLARNPKLRDELLDKANKGEIKDLARFDVSLDRLKATVEGRPLAGPGVTTTRQGDFAAEAIVRRFGRPVLLIKDGTYVEPESANVRADLLPHKARIDSAIGRVGRVEFLNHSMPWGGTGWVVDKNIVITNRHVAEIIAESNGNGGFRFRISAAGVPFGARLDLLEEYVPMGNRPSREIPVKSVKFLSRSDQPDIALLEIDADGELPEPIDLLEAAATEGQQVGIIGYPAYDSRNDSQDIARYFGEIFDVKRLAPGEIMQVAGEQFFFMHDATTLGGNSGSLVLDLATGKAIGLHFAGDYLEGNYAVTAGHIKRALKGLKSMITVPESKIATPERADGTHAVSHFSGREGYDAEFLGDENRVALPGLGTWEKDAVKVGGEGGASGKELKYTHFSVFFSESRRIPIYTAVNIDGDQAKKIKRGDDQWFADLRIPAELQLDRDDYSHPDIDRGHMVRREDPNWGTAAVARLANDDTFHYTNAAPQHARLNQGKTHWLGLEDYVLSNARTQGLSICVFTGPVMRKDDPRLDGTDIAVPLEFWKIVAAVDATSGKVRATGYVLSQGKLIEDITESFVYGEYRTYQVAISKIEEFTGLDLGKLVKADALDKIEALPGVSRVVPLDRLEDMVL